MKKLKKKVKRVAIKSIASKSVAINLGDRYVVNDVMCKVRYVNNNTGWLCPVIDDQDDTLVSRHIAYGRVYSNGKVVKI